MDGMDGERLRIKAAEAQDAGSSSKLEFKNKRG